MTNLGSWPLRRWLTAIATALGLTVAMAIPTVLIPNPMFSRDVPVTWWAWPALIASSALAGLLIASYVRITDAPAPAADEASIRGGWAGGLLTFFAVGCPVCNKLVLLALGSAGAMTWFAPVQPLLQVAGLTLLIWALHRRLRGEIQCPTTEDVHV